MGGPLFGAMIYDRRQHGERDILKPTTSDTRLEKVHEHVHARPDLCQTLHGAGEQSPGVEPTLTSGAGNPARKISAAITACARSPRQ